MHHIVYKTTNLITGKYYIGVHSSHHLKDAYLGSGIILRKSIKKYGKENFIRENLYVFDDKDKAYEMERKIVDENFVKDENTYNATVGGYGGNKCFVNLKTTSERMSAAQRKRMENENFKPWNLGKKCPQIGNKPAKTRKERGINYRGKNNPMYGVDVRTILSEDEIKEWGNKISKSLKGKKRSDESKKKYSETAKKRKWIVHISGKLSSTTNENDPRLNDQNWKLGRKW